MVQQGKGLGDCPRDLRGEEIRKEAEGRETRHRFMHQVEDTLRNAETSGKRFLITADADYQPPTY